MSSPTAERLRAAVDTLANGGSGPAGTKEHARAITSDLTIDEVLMLHSIGWQPVDLVFGLAWWSIPWGVWQYRTGEVAEASSAFGAAVDEASRTLREECRAAGGTGVVGVQLDLDVRSHHVEIALTGTAIRPVPGAHGSGVTPPKGPPFTSDLSARDFTLLLRAGWWPTELVAGASFVIAPRRSARQWAAQKGQNVELTNLTTALYSAREGAMARMQELGVSQQADGIVGVRLREGPIGRGVRAMQFVALGTTVRALGEGHRALAPEMVVSMVDPVDQFDAASLRRRR
ncbi:MAG TPA: heavy metal-binding domain-containing protein [Acidimicrobiales bacterium]